MNNQNDIIVSICSITYNHAPYIRQCLDGFLMQKTNFKYEILVHDDCSTDGTTEIIREYAKKYPNIIIPILQSVNQYQNGNKRILATFVFPKARGKYIALCEGDDYWTDPLKLQKQVDYMEKHEECGMCYTKFDILLSSNNIILHDVYETIPQRFQKVSDLATWIEKTPFVAPMTWIARNELWKSSPQIPSPDGTFIYFANFLDKTITHCIDGPSTAVYRIAEESASHTNSIKKEYERKKALYYTKISLVDYYKAKLSNTKELKTKISRIYYNRCLLWIILNKDTIELNKALNILGNDLTLKQKLFLLIFKSNIVRRIYSCIFKHKTKIRKMLNWDTKLLREYRKHVNLNKRKYPIYYKELK